MRNKDLNMINIIIFDFDGVIAESVDVKTEAFRELFRAYPEHLDEIVQFHLANGGMPRFDKFRHFYSNILKKPLSDGKFEELCRDFQKLVVDKVVEAPFVKGADRLLDHCLGRYPMYVVSGTPDAEIKDIVKRRGLGKYFKGVHGSPETKTNHVKKILADNGYDPGKVIFVGDSKNDHKAASETGIRFAARYTADKAWIEGITAEVAVADMDGFRIYLIKAGTDVG